MITLNNEVVEDSNLVLDWKIASNIDSVLEFIEAKSVSSKMDFETELLMDTAT